ncbi:WhiB family transcriptional regulator [Kineosporia sp. J2-2]|uniref:WhiB family transcriptional regulator n=1 Tax=Kineosporia corallincola TaxID=2835133 RepID=A0ABS5TMJ3_9ACTN|nr:WhiB family transcriptional regulator [Kineosporia corallincola]MBT0772321.1 WhiB family transcriptional regulator [Kineosporia corallincola]
MSDWREDAECLGMDPELFFSEKVGRPTHVKDEMTEEALMACADCPVRLECRDDADATENVASVTWGVRGGETALERILRRRRAARNRTLV